MSNVLVAGPFIGDFQQEVTCFAPYIRYISKVNQYDNVYISSHTNRRFLYDWIPDNKFIPVYETLSRDEHKQNGYIHQDVELRDYNLLVKTLKEVIQRNESCSVRDLDMHFLSYVKSINHYSYYQKVFYKFQFPKTKLPPIKDYILFIPDISLQEDFCIQLYSDLSDKYFTIVAGDQKCHLDDRNVLLKDPNYFENGYILLMNYIMNSKMVICPVSHWTYMCNLLGIPVFSWGESPGIYKREGIYGFNNNQNMTMYADYNVDTGSILNQLDYFITTILKEKM